MSRISSTIALLISAVGAQTSAADQTTYTYDALGRLIATQASTATGPTSSFYQLDAAGNRTNVVVIRANTGNVVANGDQVNILSPNLIVSPLSNDTSNDSSALVIVGVGNATNGAFAAITNGGSAIAITRITGAGTSFSYIASDGQGGYGTADIIVSTNPTFTTDTLTVPSNNNTSNNSVTINVVANDLVFQGSDKFVGGRTNGAKGDTSNNNTSVKYTPRPGYFGSDTFNYYARDDFGHSGSAPVTVTITGQNHSPTPVDDAISTSVAKSITFDPRANDSDPDGGPLRIVSTNSPAHGGIAFSGTSITYKPNAGYTGTDSFIYRVRDVNYDSAYSATATVTVTISP